jgi:hypothetical protein
VSNICVHATPDANQPIAIIYPQEVRLRESWQDKDTRISLADLCANPKILELVLNECNAVGKKSGFKDIEMLQAIVLTADEWTPESGLVTATHKLRREQIAQRYEAGIRVRLFFFLSRRGHTGSSLITKSLLFAGGFRDSEIGFFPLPPHNNTPPPAISCRLLVFLVCFLGLFGMYHQLVSHPLSIVRGIFPPLVSSPSRLLFLSHVRLHLLQYKSLSMHGRTHERC